MQTQSVSLTLQQQTDCDRLYAVSILRSSAPSQDSSSHAGSELPFSVAITAGFSTSLLALVIGGGLSVLHWPRSGPVPTEVVSPVAVTCECGCPAPIAAACPAVDCSCPAGPSTTPCPAVRCEALELRAVPAWTWASWLAALVSFIAGICTGGCGVGWILYCCGFRRQLSVLNHRRGLVPIHNW